MIDIQTELECLPTEAGELIRRAVEATLLREGAAGDVCVLITDAEEIQRLNAAYRNMDRVTDVLTFPAWEGDAILSPPDGYLGDVAICYERAEEQAQEYGHSLERELAFLSVHGALHLLGYDPAVWHMNEGHSAFLALERIREKITTGTNFKAAWDEVKVSNVFTTHTPVPAGNDQFPLWLIDKYFGSVWPELGLTHDQFVDLGKQTQSWGDSFVMPVLALKLSERANAVSELHSIVSRRMWNFLWPDRKEEDVPIDYVTNGVHTSTWLARRMALLFDLYVGDDWVDRIDDPEAWNGVLEIPDEELWGVRRHLKNKLVNFANERTRVQWQSGGMAPSQVVAGGLFLEPYSLTIGFARRFATYKRANLILRDFDRIMSLITDPYRPVQIIFAGKAHPADEPGKLLIQQVYRAVKDSRSAGRLVFLEDYDINVARYLVQGVDVWMNTPRRPNEASGTSGMKAALNGVLNFSVLDGWWREGYNGQNGWSIGKDQEYTNPDEQDREDAESLYDTLEKKIIPLYYDRDDKKIPVEWLKMVREDLRTLVPQFSLRRMLKEYTNNYYLPSINKKPAS